MELGSLPLAEIRRRYRPGGSRVTSRVIAELRGDARAGARAIAGELARRRERNAAESARLRGLLRRERELRARGFAHVAGVDEVGMGPLAGPVVAAAVILPARMRPLLELPGLDDSKRLTREARERLAGQVRELAVGFSISWAAPREIDRVNILRAGQLAMRRALARLEPAPDFALLDGRDFHEVGLAHEAVVGGDGSVASIAAASIIAKVFRDAWMRRLDRRYPGYGFDRNVGYSTAAHRRALFDRGPTPIHRRSFATVRTAGLWREHHDRRA